MTKKQRDADDLAKRASLQAGLNGGMPPLSHGFDYAAYHRGKAIRDARKKASAARKEMAASFNAPSRRSISPARIASTPRRAEKAKSGGGGLFTLLVIGGIALLILNGNHDKSPQVSKAKAPAPTIVPEAAIESPAVPATKAKLSYSVPEKATVPEQHAAPPAESLLAFAKPALADESTTYKVDPVKSAPETPSPVVVPESEIVAAKPSIEPEVMETAPRSEVTFMAGREGTANGCKNGQLVIGISRLSFSCPSDPPKGITVYANQVKGIDNNGFDVYSKGKYHFDILGLSKQQTSLLFIQWLGRARTQ